MLTVSQVGRILEFMFRNLLLQESQFGLFLCLLLVLHSLL
jgi:hypothetical protein